MKPSIENVRKLAERETTADGLLQLEDYVAFFMAGAKEAALALGHSVNEVDGLLEKARATREFIQGRIQAKQ
jgi:hypothetical protein